MATCTHAAQCPVAGRTVKIKITYDEAYSSVQAYQCPCIDDYLNPINCRITEGNPEACPVLQDFLQRNPRFS